MKVYDLAKMTHIRGICRFIQLLPNVITLLHVLNILLHNYTIQFYSALLVELDEDWVFLRDDVVTLRNIGSGNFGEVQLALISHDIQNARAQKHFRMREKNNPAQNSNLVVLKRLKGKCTCMYMYIHQTNLIYIYN